MRKWSVKTIDGCRIDVTEAEIFGASPADQLNDRLKIIIISTAESVRYINANAIVSIKETEI